ncbi:hypothetical protein EXS71_00225 [Candidatus Uhrbacteria bacterium]|nr:hypothetical protein [Candidatus Uhrbacteria bacterium]
MPTLHQRILEINAEKSMQYTTDESARNRYWASHPTFFACIKCMDGRVNFPVMTKTPVGIVKPFRAIGGKFEAWWPSFLGRVRHWVEKAESMGCRSFIFVTYHYSASDAHLGCAGWKYDTKAARAHAEKLQQELSYIFGEQMTAIVAGVETDHDLLTLHGPHADLSGEMLAGKSEAEVYQTIASIFPDMNQQTNHDLAPFLLGNAGRVEELTRQPRDLKQKGHNERIIAVGQGFDWLVEENLALIINDADPNLADSIRVAGSLIEKNLKDAPPGDDATIFTSIPYRNPGLDYRQAVVRSQGLRLFAERVLQESFPDLMKSGRLHSLAAVMWEANKKIEII